MNAPSNLAARYATLADAPAIAALHSASWRDAYAPLLAPHRLPDTLEAEHLAMWTATIPQVAPGRLLVVEADGTEILAFLSTVPDPDGDAAAEHLAALHVAPGAQGMGLGALLLSGVAANCHAEGRQRLWCWVLTGNAGARAFYARLGGTEAAA
ncbi:MAG: GNAT family N-acetyltransferase, partial [Pseudomonadota bacterium]